MDGKSLTPTAAAAAATRDSEPREAVWAELAAPILDDESLVRAIAAGQRQRDAMPWRRVEIRWVDLRAGRHLQVTRYDATQAHTSNHEAVEARRVVEELLRLPFANWHVETTAVTLQVRVTKKGRALVHRSAGVAAQATRGHDRVKARHVSPDDPMLRALGITDAQGRVKPTRERKYRQVEEFLTAALPALDEAIAAGRLPTPSPDRPLRVVDLGCGNGYLTFALQSVLASRGLLVEVVGVDVKEQSREHNTAVAETLGVGESTRFEVGTIADVVLDPAPDVVVALHACDTATDDALARAVEWGSGLLLAAPCCHHDVAAQIKAGTVQEPYAAITRHGILRERLADTLTDALRAAILRREGYRVDVIEFVESQHTPRNTMLRATLTGHRSATAAAEAAGLAAQWGVRPALENRLTSTSRRD